MDRTQLEGLFFRPAPTTASEHAANLRESSGFRPPPIRAAKAPYHMQLAETLPARTKAIQDAGRIVFHTVGDSGGVNGVGAQENVADHMTRQINSAKLPEQPSFFYHLGDVVYYNGENDGYHDQFYHPYQDYPAPIFAIPGNHDGSNLDPAQSLVPFMTHFCSDEPRHPEEAVHALRPTMTQPNCYWRLEAPFVTIVGLYSNVSGELDDARYEKKPQRDWLIAELKSVPTDKCLILAVHHPLFSLGKHGGSEPVRQSIEAALDAGGRTPDMILTGHDHCYQRFTWKRGDRQIPVLVVGAGGFATYDDLTPVDTAREPQPGTKLMAHEDKHPGFLRVSVSPKHLRCEYFTVPHPDKQADPEKSRDSFVVDLETHKLD